MPFSGKTAWALLAGVIIAYEVACEEEQLLSRVVDEWLISHPIFTRVAIAAVSLHLANLLPAYADPLGKRLWEGLFKRLGPSH